MTSNNESVQNILKTLVKIDECSVVEEEVDMTVWAEIVIHLGCPLVPNLAFLSKESDTPIIVEDK